MLLFVNILENLSQVFRILLADLEDQQSLQETRIPMHWNSHKLIHPEQFLSYM